MNFSRCILLLSLICASCLKTSFGSLEIGSADWIEQPKVLDPSLRSADVDISAHNHKRQLSAYVTNHTCVCIDGFCKNKAGNFICLKDCKGRKRPAHEIDCKFPFKFNGQWVNSCTNTGKNFYWCSLDKTFKGRFVKCSESCPLLASKMVEPPNVHTACLVKASNVLSVTLPQSANDIAVQLHNAIRSAVKVPAANLRAVAWDEDLASLAAKWAENGELKHDCHNCRRNLNHRDFGVGQNVFAISTSKITNYTELIGRAIVSWHSEIKYYVYEKGSTTGNDNHIGHYTQIVNSGVSRIGCGAAMVKDIRTVVVCNYGTGQSSFKIPYISGLASQTCSSSNIKNNLCQCTKFCRNGGTLDPKTCTCKCPNHTTGADCEKLLCDKSDREYGCLYEANTFCKYSNVAPLCPHLCGVCDFSYVNLKPLA